MFCDMVGPSALSTRLDPEEQGDVIAAFHACCANEIKTFRGMVAQYLGDGVLAYFGYPTAHENDAERAILAGLAILKAITSLRPAPDVALQTRIAIGSGVVVVGDLVRQGVTQENAAIGETTNLVARLQAIAEPNSVVISPVTHHLVGALFDYRDLGRHTFKGFAEPVHVRQVLGPSNIESRFEALRTADLHVPPIGREEELDLLLRHWWRALSGEGQVVLVSGEAGIGKSRLLAALQEALAAEEYVPLIWYCSPQHVDSALYPVITRMERAAGFVPGDGPEARGAKLAALLRRLIQSRRRPASSAICSGFRPALGTPLRASVRSSGGNARWRRCCGGWRRAGRCSRWLRTRTGPTRPPSNYSISWRRASWRFGCCWW